MSYLEELLPEFRKGAKIRQNDWPDGVYIFVRNGEILPSHPSLDVKDDNDLISNKWEFYQEPIDWEYIIDHKCLCWFWDDDDTDGVMAILVSVYKDSPYRYYCRDLAGCGSSRKHFRPIRKDEVTFYEDKRDGNN